MTLVTPAVIDFIWKGSNQIAVEYSLDIINSENGMSNSQPMGVPQHPNLMRPSVPK